jgi:hypothetical protein
VKTVINPLNAELYPISHLLALLGADPILHVSRIRVNLQFPHVVGNLLTSGVVTAFSRRTEFRAWYHNGMYM